MSTGISISSINRIKELAEEKKYADALEILDTQNLEKSINPQFLRISGEIFRANKRYYDSRKILLKAHQMSPQGLRIIAELIQLYLELGYFSKAQKYYEQYLFYATSDDVQKDYVEYIMKKATGSDIKELASILIPILERMPEDRWNFEAVLLYDKMDRKDKALDESRYILEHFKESVYVEPIIQYIDDKLDIDTYFDVYPSKEVEEDVDLYQDLIELEEKLLEEDYLRMYPPEAKIRVEAEDKEPLEIKPVREKKQRKKRKKADQEVETVEASPEDKTEAETKDLSEEVTQKQKGVEDNQSVQDIVDGQDLAETKEQQIQKERQIELEKILSKETSSQNIRETAKKVAKTVREIDVEKAKTQAKVVADAAKENVKKATEVLSEAVGAKVNDTDVADKDKHDDIVDGIIESVIEAPKKSVGQVVMNEELDALIPDSLEALSEEEVVEIETKKAEEDRIELEALETQLRMEEEKKTKRKTKKKSSENVETIGISDDSKENDYLRLKEQFLADNEEPEEQPLESLGFISVVQSDIDEKMEEDIPFAAGILHQMIDNKEFYTGEDSTKFETKASYENHGFEIEDYEFYADDHQDMAATQEELYNDASEERANIPMVEIIFAKEDIIDFSDFGFEEKTDEEASSSENVTSGEEQLQEMILDEEVNSIEEKQQEIYEDEYKEIDTNNVFVEDENSWSTGVIKSDVRWENDDNQEAEPAKEEQIEDSETDVTSEEIEQKTENIDLMEGEKETKQEANQRDDLRIRIIITSGMNNVLMQLKESR
ncbi:MAG: hypothetical protein Q4D51_08100 [Eubacteriales bacterium]|nr:hypothetical protein [Eubacteriales bacterium]